MKLDERPDWWEPPITITKAEFGWRATFASDESARASLVGAGDTPQEALAELLAIIGNAGQVSQSGALM